MPNPFVHAELTTNDIGKAKAFYGALFDWKLNESPMGDQPYTIIDVGDNGFGVGGGMLQLAEGNVPTHWVPYVLVDDLGAATQKAVSLGATVIRENVEVPKMGSFSILKDPTGGVFGMWKTSGQD